MNAPKVWTREMVEDFAKTRGEHIPSNPVWSEMLLAYLRSKGRVEDNVDRKQAEQDFIQLAKHVDFDKKIPPPQAHEFQPFQDMRRELADLRMRADQRIAGYKAKTALRAQEAQPNQPQPSPAPSPPPERRPSNLLGKARQLAATALKTPERGERDR